MKKRLLQCCLLACMLTTGCQAKNSNQIIDTPFFSKGADISWITEMEANGKKFFNANGIQQDIFSILKDYQINTIRLRVWVNPVNNYNAIADVLVKAQRAKAAGMRIMIDFHYSDNWADPGKQTKPIAWQQASALVLADSVYQHTFTVLQVLKSNNITPHYIQIGNETNNGMLWPEGRASTNMGNFVSFIKKGCLAAKTIFPTAKTIVHISNGWDNALFKWIFDGLQNHGAEYDIIGMSLYPSITNWQQLNTQCLANIQDMISRYNKEVMVVEVGMSWDEAVICKQFITDLKNKLGTVPNNKALGILYWEPQAYNWQGYTLGAFNNNGRPTVALEAFKD